MNGPYSLIDQINVLFIIIFVLAPHPYHLMRLLTDDFNMLVEG